MRTSVLLFAAAAFCTAAPALAADPIDGTWKTDPDKIEFSKKPSVWSINGGTYKCETCTPPWSVPADGKPHATPGRPYVDEATVTVVDARTIKMASKQKGKALGSSTSTLSDDGKTLSIAWTDTSAPSGIVANGVDTLSRVAAAPPGAHPSSGSWLTVKTTSDNAAVWEQSFMMEGDTLKLTTPQGESYAAKLGGPPVPIVGDRANTMVTVTKSGDRTFVESGTRDGKPIYVMTFTVADDGKSVNVTSENKQTNATTKFIAYKQ